MRTGPVGVAVGVLLVAAAGIAVDAAPAGAVVVSTEAQLQTAFADVNEVEITLANDIELTCAGGGALSRTAAQALVLRGQGFSIRQTCPGERVLEVLAGSPLTLSQVTVTGGTPATSGGGILAEGDLIVEESRITGNSSSGSGGGIFADTDRVQITRSTIDGNSAVNVGGGFFGIGTELHTTVINSTVVANQASEAGGLGVQTDAEPGLELVYSTAVDNSALAGANVGGRRLVAFGSVIALGMGGGTDCFVPFITSNGYNFDGDDSCDLVAPTDLPGAGDPLLGPLGANGGPTPTRVPQPGSALLDAIPVASCQDDGAAGVTTDQRGIARPQLGGCEIGAVEVPAPEPLVLTPTFTG